MVARQPGRFLAAVMLAMTLTAGALAGCSGKGATSSCSTTQCTITFERSTPNASIKILGVQVELVSATDNSATLKVAGAQVTINRGEGLNVGNLSVKVTEITPNQIVVQASRG
jgi:hypothetical protein